MVDRNDASKYSKVSSLAQSSAFKLNNMIDSSSNNRSTSVQRQPEEFIINTYDNVSDEENSNQIANGYNDIDDDDVQSTIMEDVGLIETDDVMLVDEISPTSCYKDPSKINQTFSDQTNLATIQKFISQARQAQPVDINCQPSTSFSGDINQAAQAEVLMRNKLTLRKKELVWKLHKNSWTRNKLKLDHVRNDALLKKKKAKKLSNIANQLRLDYLQATSAAEKAALNFKEAEQELFKHEKVVAQEQMLIAKLAVECQNQGSQLYGKDYRIEQKITIPVEKTTQNKTLLEKQMADFEKQASANSPAGAKRLSALNASMTQSTPVGVHGASVHYAIKIARLNLNSLMLNITSTFQDRHCNGQSCYFYEHPQFVYYDLSPTSVFDKSLIYRYQDNQSANFINQYEKNLLRLLVSNPVQGVLSYNKQPPTDDFISSMFGSKGIKYDFKESPLQNLALFRLTPRYSRSGNLITDLRYCHNLYPKDYVCLADLLDLCADKNCRYQHKSKYIMSDLEKLADILSYKQSISQTEANSLDTKALALKLKEMAAELITKNAKIDVEVIAKNLVKLFWSDKQECEIISLTRMCSKLTNISERCGPSATLIDSNYLRKLATNLENVAYSDFDFKHDNPLIRKIFNENIRPSYTTSDLSRKTINENPLNCTQGLDAELNVILTQQPDNVQSWLSLAFRQLNDPNGSYLAVMEKAVSTIAANELLWHNYLILLANFKDANKESLRAICGKALTNSPSFRIYKLVILLTEEYDQKIKIALSLLDFLKSCSSNLQNNFLHSKHVLLASFFLIEMFVHGNDSRKANEFIEREFSKPSLYTTVSPTIGTVSQYLLSDQLQFAHLVIIYVKIYGHFPTSRLITNGQTLAKIISMEQFLIKIPGGIQEKEMEQVQKLVELFKIPINNVKLNIGEMNSVYHLGDVVSLYRQAKESFMMGNSEVALGHLRTIIDIFMRLCHIFTPGDNNPSLMKATFKSLIKNTQLNQDSMTLSVLWLSLILIARFEREDEIEIEGKYSRAINQYLCTSKKKKDDIGLKFFVIEYIYYLIEKVHDRTSFDSLLAAVKHWCTTIHDQDFQVLLIETVLYYIPDSNSRMKILLLIDFCKFMPQHLGIIKYTLGMCLLHSHQDITVTFLERALNYEEILHIYDDWTWLV